MKRQSSHAFALAALATLLAGCGGRSAAGPAGTYALDKPAFVESAVDALIDAGQIPPHAAGLARQQLEQLTFELELEPGGEFSCHMGTPAESHEYTGTWRLDGTTFSLHQTHEDGREVTDTMTGTLDGDVLRLRHDEDGLDMEYVLNRQGGVPATPN